MLGWGDINYFESANWDLSIDPMIAGIVGGMVQMFFAWRLHILVKRIELTLFLVLLSVSTFCGGVGTGIGFYWIKDFSSFMNLRGIIVTWLLSAAVADIIITVALTYHLHELMGNFAATDRFLDSIISLTVRNGLLTAVFALLDVILYLGLPGKPYHLGIMNNLHPHQRCLTL
ncbi:hypothetical protein HWV62_38026 [Athelia sp. TMB]|nr:hypothetical protein HWV62_38026 [Athelia sp. TMB]